MSVAVNKSAVVSGIMLIVDPVLRSLLVLGTYRVVSVSLETSGVL